LILIIFYHPFLNIGGVERRFLSVMKQWETINVRFRILESQLRLRTSSHQIPTLINKDTPLTYIVRGLAFALLSIVLALKDRGFNVILAYNNDVFSVASAFIISKIYRKPCVVIVHHYDIIDGSQLVESLLRVYSLLRRIGYGRLYSLFKALATKLAIIMAKKCKATICISKAFAKLFANAYLSSNAIEYSPKNAVTLKDKEYEACFVGRLDARKGVIDLLNVWKNVVSILPNAKLAIVGPTQTRGRNFMKIIRSHGLDKNIVYMGLLSDRKMYDTIKKSRLFVTLSLSEGWGMAIAEALACGVPVACYNIITLYEQWNTCPYVIFANANDVKDATEKIIEFLRSPDPDSQQVKKCIEGLRWENVARRDLEILRKVVNDTYAH